MTLGNDHMCHGQDIGLVVSARPAHIQIPIKTRPEWVHNPAFDSEHARR